jgi:SAM-dependent methyltransferase
MNESDRLMELIDGFVATQLLYVAAKLGIADTLSVGAQSAGELAEATGADPATLRRVLRGLAAVDVLDERDDGRFALGALGEALRPLQGAAIARGEVYYDSAAGLFEAVMKGGVPYELTHSARFFDHLGQHPSREAAFQGSMAGRAELEAAAVVAAYDFTQFETVVDVGGGRGVLLGAILEAAPEIRGTLIDRPAAIPDARAYLESAGHGERAACVAGDFFVGVPPGADAYVLSRVLHDWPDADAARILETCRRAMRPDGRVLVVDAVLPRRAVDKPAAIRMDIHMLLLLGARERTEAEFRDLAASAGFVVDDVTLTASPAGLGVVEMRPALQ